MILAAAAHSNTPITLVIGIILLLFALVVFIFFFLNKLPFMRDRARKRPKKEKRGKHEDR